MKSYTLCKQTIRLKTLVREDNALEHGPLNRNQTQESPLI